MKKYGWRQVAQWKMPEPEDLIRYREVDTEFSKALCAFILVENINMPYGVIRTRPIDKKDVMPEMLEIAGNP